MMNLRSTLARKVLQNVAYNSAVARASKAVAVATYKSHTNLNDKWLNRLRISATSNDAREQHGQLSALVEYFNRPAQHTEIESIDWEEWKNKIHTPSVVENIEKKYNEFMTAEYNVEEAAAKTAQNNTKLQNLEYANTYNFVLWLVHYMLHINQIESMRNIGDVTMLSHAELLHYMPGIEPLNSMEFEIGNFSPSTLEENGIVTRLHTQFSWGTRVLTPFVHSNDAINAVVSTLGKLGK